LREGRRKKAEGRRKKKKLLDLLQKSFSSIHGPESPS